MHNVNQDILRLAPREVGVWAKRTCPLCASERKPSHQRLRTLGVIVDSKGYLGWNCAHCGNKGSMRMQSQVSYPRSVTPAPSPAIEPPKKSQSDVAAMAYMAERGIGEDTYRAYGLYQSKRYFTQLGGEANAVCFPVFFQGKERFVKFRAAERGKFFTSQGSAPCLFGDQLYNHAVEHLVITEGEIDAMSFHHAGIYNAMSVPNGAQQVSDGERGYLWGSRAAIERSKKVIIATDGDAPGLACGEELARRIGKHKCWTVDWPEGCKDANDVLVKFGKDKLVEVFEAAKPWPVAGLYDTLHYSDKFYEMLANGDHQGLSTGIQEVDRIYRIAPGQLTVVTGIPGSGKSEFIDQLMVNLAEREDWRFAICSFENSPPKHIRKILEKHARRPTTGPGALAHEELDGPLGWLQNHFYFIQQADGQPSTIESILERARVAVLRYGIRGLVVDPYNYITRGSDSTETLWVSDMLTAVRAFAEGCGVHVWFVAHPQKLQRQGGELPMPGGYDISGSAAWFAKADAGITVGRTRTDNVSIVECWKQREKSLGQLGTAVIKYDPVTGIYSDGGQIDPIKVEGYDDEDDFI